MIIESITNPASYEYDIFLSHNHQDQDWTARRAERLEQEDWQGRKLRRLYGESLEISKRLGDRNGIAITLGQLGKLSAQEGDGTEGARLLREAVSIFEKLKSPKAEIARLMLAEVEKGEAS
jgi:hypothetical protein